MDDLLVVHLTGVGGLDAQQALQDVGIKGIQVILNPDGSRLNDMLRIVAGADIIAAHHIGDDTQLVEPVVKPVGNLTLRAVLTGRGCGAYLALILFFKFNISGIAHFLLFDKGFKDGYSAGRSI